MHGFLRTPFRGLAHEQLFSSYLLHYAAVSPIQLNFSQNFFILPEEFTLSVRINIWYEELVAATCRRYVGPVGAPRLGFLFSVSHFLPTSIAQNPSRWKAASSAVKHESGWVLYSAGRKMQSFQGSKCVFKERSAIHRYRMAALWFP